MDAGAKIAVGIATGALVFASMALFFAVLPRAQDVPAPGGTQNVWHNQTIWHNTTQTIWKNTTVYVNQSGGAGNGTDGNPPPGCHESKDKTHEKHEKDEGKGHGHDKDKEKDHGKGHENGDRGKDHGQERHEHERHEHEGHEGHGD